MPLSPVARTVLALASALALVGALDAHAQIPCLSGFVRDAQGNPVAGADLDFIDPVTGVKLVTPGDNTDAAGFYNVCVLPGTYHVTFAPAPGSHLLGRRFDDLDMSTGRVLDVTLQSGVALFGTVRDTAGQPVVDADLDVDRLTGGRLFTPGDNTDPFGSYWVVVPPGEYRVRFDPPPGGRLRGLQVDTVIITGDRNLDVALEAGLLLSGQVRDLPGTGLPDIDVELREPGTGAKVFLSNNSTDTVGRFSVAAPAGTFDLRFVPPRGSRLLGVLIDTFPIAGDRVWDQTMEYGTLVTAFVHDSAGHPIAGADIDYKQQVSGQKLFTPNDKTDSTGFVYSAVPADLYVVQVDPPVGSVFDQFVQADVSVAGDTLLDIELAEVARVAFSGRVIDGTGAGVAGAHIGILSQATGKSAFVPNDLTDSLGFFDVRVPKGQFHVLIAPPAGSRLVAARRDGISFTGDTAWSPLTLLEGVIATVEVFDENGQPATGADLDFLTEPDLVEAYTPYDNIDAAGSARVALAPGTYALRVEPPPGSGLAGVMLPAVSIVADTVITLLLGATTGIVPERPFVLRQNFPNPFNGETSIRFVMLEASYVSLQLYNILGQPVRLLWAGDRTVGLHELAWDGTDNSGQPVASGVYFYRLETPAHEQTRKLLLLR